MKTILPNSSQRNMNHHKRPFTYTQLVSQAISSPNRKCQTSTTMADQTLLLLEEKKSLDSLFGFVRRTSPVPPSLCLFVCVVFQRAPTSATLWCDQPNIFAIFEKKEVELQLLMSRKKASITFLFLATDQELHRLRLRAEQTGHHAVLGRSGQPTAARHR